MVEYKVKLVDSSGIMGVSMKDCSILWIPKQNESSPDFGWKNKVRVSAGSYIEGIASCLKDQGKSLDGGLNKKIWNPKRLRSLSMLGNRLHLDFIWCSFQKNFMTMESLKRWVYQRCLLKNWEGWWSRISIIEVIRNLMRSLMQILHHRITSCTIWWI